MKDQLHRVSRILAEKENDIVNVVQSENDIMQKLRDRLEIVEEEKHILQVDAHPNKPSKTTNHQPSSKYLYTNNPIRQAKLNMQEKSQNNLPQLIDTMLAEKNDEIDRLRDQLHRRERQLEVFLSIDEAQLREILVRQNEQQQQQQQKNSARTLSDILSINSEYEELSELVREAPNYTRSQNMSHFKMPHSVVVGHGHGKRDVVDFSNPITETPKVPRLELDSPSRGSEAIEEHSAQVSKEVSGFLLEIFLR